MSKTRVKRSAAGRYLIQYNPTAYQSDSQILKKLEMFPEEQENTLPSPILVV